MVTITSALPNWNIKNKRVFLRADLNVPLNDDPVVHDHRLQAARPTIDAILKKGGTIILATHLGRPQKASDSLSTKQLVPWFKKHGYTIEYVANLDDAYTKSLEKNNTIILLENLRFFPGEQAPLDTTSTKSLPKSDFAKKLARLGDFYINDAFGTLHRNDTSLTLTPKHFAREKRTVGLLVEKETKTLNKLLSNPKKPFVLIIGGGKIKDKIPAIKSLLDVVDTIMLCPAAVFTFLHALGKPVGKSLVDVTMQQKCKDILNAAQEKKITILFPQDYVVANDTTGPLSTVSAKSFPENSVGVSIGPKTGIEWSAIIQNAKTIFYAGLMGTVQKKDTLMGVEKIFKAMEASPGLSIIGGGDSVTAAQLLGLDSTINFCSSGGGATLAYLASEQLPGLKIFT